MLQKLFEIVDHSDIDEMVFTMNHIFGTKTFKDAVDPNNPDAQDDEMILFANSQVKNVYDEVEELIEAIRIDAIQRKDELGTSNPQYLDAIVLDDLDMDKNGYNEIFDALGDILTFALGGLYIVNFNTLPDYNIECDGTIDTLYADALGSYKYLHEQTKKTLTPHDVRMICIKYANFAITWAHALNYDIEELMRAVTKSNYTKLMFSEDEIRQTMDKYHKLGVTTYVKEYTQQVEGEDIHYGVIYSSADQTDINGKSYRKDKFLKGVNFKEPQI